MPSRQPRLWTKEWILRKSVGKEIVSMSDLSAEIPYYMDLITKKKHQDTQWSHVWDPSYCIFIWSEGWLQSWLEFKQSTTFFLLHRIPLITEALQMQRCWCCSNLAIALGGVILVKLFSMSVNEDSYLQTGLCRLCGSRLI